MEPLTNYWLVVVLAGVSVDLGPQPDCRESAMEWLVQAKAWQARSGVIEEPMWFCGEPRMYQASRRVLSVSR